MATTPYDRRVMRPSQAEQRRPLSKMGEGRGSRTSESDNKRMLVDHVIYGVEDASATVSELRRIHGLGAVEGVYHRSLGTHNWLVPLRWPQYIEILEIADEEAAAQSPMGSQIAARIAQGEGLLNWAVLAEDIAAIAARTSVEPFDLQAQDADSKTTTTTMVFGSPDLPFFVTRSTDPAELRELFDKRRTAARHDNEPGHITWIEQGGDENQVKTWLHDETLPVRYAGGAPGPRTVAITTVRGEIALP
jgi:hypothetical protein